MMTGRLDRRLELLEQVAEPPRRIVVATRAQADAWRGSPPPELDGAIIVITGIDRDPGSPPRA